jgi:phenylalanyl-tRNA synthetase alpha chain
VSSSVPHLSPAQLRAALGIRDLSDPGEGSHAIQILLDRAVAALSRTWSCEVRWCRGAKVVPVADNYDRLGYAAGAITREVRYTRYVSSRRMLRSHSSAMIPPALRQLARDQVPRDQRAGGPGRDGVLLVCPGMVYRRDAIDWQHSGTPHQLDLWLITRRAMADADLDEMISSLLEELVPDLPYRQEPTIHPYTEHGRQVDVRLEDRWVEVWECGLAHPSVLDAAGLAGRSGLALGMGLDRMLMLIKGVPDIRLLRSADPRIADQMRDLAAYRPVSSMPPVLRDLSVAVAEDEDEETLGDLIRDALGTDVSCVEEVRVLSATSCSSLPAAAIRRLGARPDQKNLLVRVVLRDLEKTLTNEAANSLRDRIYLAIHHGTEHQWAHRAAARGAA